ncbi:MAG: DUF4271 domain-containing protein [Bacteroidales bacterium]|nr:DUF4271 domain-containing protein [Bacteroidales bacterium]
MLFDSLALFSALVVLLLLRRLVNVFPSVMACLWRGKECFNLESSVKLAHDRDVVALAMMIPFCLTAFHFRLYSPNFLLGFGETALLGMYFAVLAGYVLLRVAVFAVFRPKVLPSKTLAAALKVAWTFFIFLTLLLLAMGGIMSRLGVAYSVIRSAMLWVSAAVYALFLLRKLQIFNSSCSVFAGFLYLCALEMIPTGILIVSAIVF